MLPHSSFRAQILGAQNIRAQIQGDKRFANLAWSRVQSYSSGLPCLYAKSHLCLKLSLHLAKARHHLSHRLSLNSCLGFVLFLRGQSSTTDGEKCFKAKAYPYACVYASNHHFTYNYQSGSKSHEADWFTRWSHALSLFPRLSGYQNVSSHHRIAVLMTSKDWSCKNSTRNKGARNNGARNNWTSKSGAVKSSGYASPASVKSLQAAHSKAPFNIFQLKCPHHSSLGVSTLRDWLLSVPSVFGLAHLKSGWADTQISH